MNHKGQVARFADGIFDRGPAPWRLLLFSLASASLMAFASCSAREEADVPYRYRLSILREYEIHKTGVGAQGLEEFELVRRSGASLWEVVVPDVEAYGICGNTIYGTTRDGFFILDTVSRDRAFGEAPVMFASRDEWLGALRKRGLAAEPRLLDPDQVASTRPRHELHPEKYLVMHRLFGLSDDDWGFGVIILAGLASFLTGLCGLRAYLLVSFAILLGVGGNILGQMMIAHEGPGAFVGFFVWPPLCLGAALCGRRIRAFVMGVPERRPGAGARRDLSNWRD